MTRAKTYLLVFTAFFVLVVGCIAALNLLLGERALGSAAVVQQASAWQQATRGVTFAPPVTQARAFKAHRLADRASEVNTLVLGASSLMGVTQAMFPAPLRMYNFSLTANPTAAIAAEAEYVVRHHPNVRTLLIGLDWVIGMIYRPDEVRPIDLTPAVTLVGYGAAEVPWHRRLADALSSPKVASLGRALGATLRSPTPAASAKALFFEPASADYRCADGAWARDYDVANRGICLGFRHDGSWTFAGEVHLSEARAQTLARAAAAPSSKFSKFLCDTRGEPDRAVLRQLGAVAKQFVAQGGAAIFIIPPLLPGMEAEMSKTETSRRCLARTKAALDAWAREHQVTIIDAAASEHFGCVASEFLDENHAWPECHARILARYWRDKAQQRVPAGLYRPAIN